MLKIKAPQGFTLLELLIVVAMIGILSTVILATTNDARLKARNAQKIEIIRQYILGMEVYNTLHNTYPFESSVGLSAVCLGKHVGGVCGFSGLTDENATLNQQIQTVYPSMPVFEPIDYRNFFFQAVYTGPTYSCVVISGDTCQKYQIQWMLEGGQDCVIGQVEEMGTDTLCYYRS